MKKFTVDGTEYKLEYSFEAALDNDCVQNMFNMLTGAYIYKNIPSGEDVGKVEGTVAMVEGFSQMFADTPKVCTIAFRAGLRENHPDLDDATAKALMKRYMKNKKFGFNDLFNELIECMEKDGFFKLTNLQDAIDSLNQQGKEAENDQTESKKN